MLFSLDAALCRAWILRLEPPVDIWGTSRAEDSKSMGPVLVSGLMGMGENEIVGQKEVAETCVTCPVEQVVLGLSCSR